MRSRARIIATAAVTFILMPAFTAGTAVAASGADAAASVTAAPAMTAFEGPTTGAGRTHFAPPRFELFVGYSYLRAVPSESSANRLAWLNGGSTSIAFNLNPHLGIVGDFSGFDDTKLDLRGTNPHQVPNSSGTVFTYLVGPRLSFVSHDRITPFAQVLFGGVHASAVTLSDCSGVACTPLPTENKFAMTAGAGLDIKVSRRIALRIIQAEYLMTRFENHDTGAGGTQNDVRLSSGLVFRFSGGQGQPKFGPVSYACSVNPSSAFPGDSIAVSGTAANLNPAKTAVYAWSVDGGTVAGTSDSARIDTANLAPGTYTLKGHVSEGAEAGDSADCTADYSVKAFEPPTVSCSANPASVAPGGSATITAAAVSPQNRALTYSYASSSGSVRGTGSTAMFSAVGIAPGVVTVTCNVVDDKGQTASAGTTVTVEQPAVPPQPVTSELCSIHFDRDGRRPARVDNEAKACLDEVALNLQRRTDAKLAIVGHASGEESQRRKLSDERAFNTKVYLVGEKGIDASRIAIYSGPRDGRTVSMILIPEGATFDITSVTPADVKAVKTHPRTPSQGHP
jgi:opacity protein-like surface antigen/outer membrane protein OmpA-like peptidoglycan-associated protein